jgi:hypothetical protein
MHMDQAPRCKLYVQYVVQIDGPADPGVVAADAAHPGWTGTGEYFQVQALCRLVRAIFHCFPFM